MSSGEPTAAPHGATLLETIRSDHAAIARGVQRLLCDEVHGSDPSLLVTTLAAIERHLALEEAELYPVMRASLRNGESEVIRVMAHTELIEQGVDALRSRDLSPDDRSRQLASLRSLLAHHIDLHEERYALALT
jgi:hypothetical protein